MHKILHTGERPFKCEICEKTFVRYIDLIKHNKSVKHVKKLESINCVDCGEVNNKLENKDEIPVKPEIKEE